MEGYPRVCERPGIPQWRGTPEGVPSPAPRAAAFPSELPAKLTFQLRVFRCFPSLHPTQPALGESPCIPPTAQVAELDRGDTCAIKFPGAPRRYFTRNRVKGPKFSGATRRNPANGAKRPQIFRRYAPGDPPPDFPTHIKYVSTALFSSLAYSKRGQFEPSLRALSVERLLDPHACLL